MRVPAAASDPTDNSEVAAVISLGFIFVLALVLLTTGCATPRARFAHGERLEREGQYTEALAVYQDLAARIPPAQKHAIGTTYLRIGQCLWHLNRLQDAFQAFQIAVKADPANRTARVRLGELYLASGELERASEQANSVLAEDPGDPDALTLLGTIVLDQGDIPKAKEYFTRVLKAQPGNTTIAIALADVYDQENHPDAARQVLRTAGNSAAHDPAPWLALGRLEEVHGDSRAAEDAYRHAVAIDDTPATNLRLAQFLQRSSRITEAEGVLTHVDRLRPAQPSALADFQFSTGRVVQAVHQYVSELHDRFWAPAARPDDTAASAMLAPRLIEADLESIGTGSEADVTAAVERARIHLDLYRSELDDATIAILETEIALTQGDLSQATLHAGTALTLAPNSPAARYVMGVTEYRTGDTAHAASLWDSAVDIDPHFVPALLALAHQELETGDLKNAEDSAATVVRQEPANLRALTVYARILLAEKDYPSAISIAERAVAADPKASEPHVILGDIGLADGRIGGALMQFEQALLLDSQSTSAIDGLIRVYRHGQITHALLHRMEVEAANPPASATLMEIVGRLNADHGWYQDAARCLKRAVEIDSGRSSAMGALTRVYAEDGNLSAAASYAEQTGGANADLLAGLQAQDRGDIPAAIRSYEDAFRHGDRTGIAANNLAWLYAQQGTHLSRALMLANTAHGLAPEDANIFDTLGTVYLKLREYSAAVGNFEMAVRTAEQQRASTAHFRRHLADAYVLVGRPDAARQQLVKLRASN